MREVMGERNQVTLGAVTNLAVTYNAMERYEDARSILEPNLAVKRQVLGVNHTFLHVAINTLAQTYEGLGRSDEALELEREHLGLHLAQANAPNAPPAAMNRAANDLLTQRRSELRDPERALAYAQKACALEEETGGTRLWIFLETLARAQYATGDADAAIETQQRALSLVPEGADPGARERMETLLAGMRAGEPSAQLTPPLATVH